MEMQFIVQNLKCGGCANTIQSKLNQLDGITNVSVSVESSTVNVSFNENTNPVKIEDTLKTIGYPIIGDDNSLLTKTRSVISCATGKMA